MFFGIVKVNWLMSGKRRAGKLRRPNRGRDTNLLVELKTRPVEALYVGAHSQIYILSRK